MTAPQMDISTMVIQNAQNISALTRQITELAGVTKHEAERSKELRVDFAQMMAEIRDLSKQISAVAGLQKENSAIIAEMAGLRKDIDSTRKDIGALLAIKEKLDDTQLLGVKTETRADQLEKWKERHNLTALEASVAAMERRWAEHEVTAKNVKAGVKWFWAVGGAVVTAAVGGVTLYKTVFQEPAFYTQSSTFERRVPVESNE